jgi:orotidine-5'-phosphate decarboxylase
MGLSTKQIPRDERLIVALDVPSQKSALAVVDQLGDVVKFYKLGLELMMSGEYFDVLKELVQRGKKVFADVKFYDVPETVKGAVRGLAEKGATFVTVHGNESILKAACEVRGSLQVLAVTVLTSLDETDLREMGFTCALGDLVLHRAERALAAGCAGVISSPHEAHTIRQKFGDRLLIVAPGIRQEPGHPDDDQKRAADPRTAFLNGADYIVVGRPIRRASNPRAAAERVQADIASLFH